MADSSWPTLAEVKAYLGVTVTDDDEYLQQQIDTSILNIENYCGRHFEAMDDVEVFRLTDFDRCYNGINGLRVKRIPIQTITSVINTNDEGVTLTYMQGENGFIYGDFITRGQEVTITYRGGFEDNIPADVLTVFYDMMSTRYALKGYQVSLTGNLKSQSIPGVMSEGYYNTGSDNVTTGFGKADASNFDYTLDNYVIRDF